MESPLAGRGVLDRRLMRALLIVALALAGGGLVWMISAVFAHVHNTLVIAIFAVLFAYVVYPPIALLVRRGVPVAIAGIVVYAVLAVFALLAIAWLAPAIAAQTQDLTQNFPHIVANVQREIANPTDLPLLQHLPSGVRDQIAKNAGKAGQLAGGAAAAVGSNAVVLVTGTTTVLVDIALVLGLTLLIVGDLPQIAHFGLRLVPRAQRTGAVSFMRDVDVVVGGFVRGQVAIALGIAAVGSVVLAAVGVPYAILLGLLAGVISIVPLVGPIAAVIPVLAISLLTVGLVKSIVVVVLFGIILAVQQNVLVPLVVSKSVGVTPLVVFVALLLGSEAFGILGALLSIPLAGILRVAALRLFPPDPTIDAAVLADSARKTDAQVAARIGSR